MTGFDKQEKAAAQEQLQQLSERIAAQQQLAAPQKAADAGADDGDAQASRVGYELLGAVLACTGLGYLVDRQIGSLPVGTVTGVFLGFLAGIVNAWRATSGVERAVGLRKPETAARDKDGGLKD